MIRMLRVARRLLILLPILMLMPSCATIIRGTEQEVFVNTNPTGARVQFSNGQGCISPCSIVSKRNQSLLITVTKDDCQTQTVTMVPTLAGGGVILGGLIDYGTGAVYDLQPNPLVLSLACEAGSSSYSQQLTRQAPSSQWRETREQNVVPVPAVDRSMQAIPRAPAAPSPHSPQWHAPSAPPAEMPPVVQPVDDPCAKYRGTPNESRCRLYAGPNGWQHIPPAGRNADLDMQIRCAPFRSSPTSYERCISGSDGAG